MNRSRTRLYGIWEHIIQRCENPKDRSYKNYGARGVHVCAEWHNSNTFIEWALQNGYNDSLSIDRVDVDGFYCPENCRWADLYTQRNNTRRNHKISILGETLTLRQAADKYAINYDTLKTRIRRGVIPEAAVGLKQNISKEATP